MTASGHNLRFNASLFNQRSRALSSLQWMHVIPQKGYTMFLQFRFAFE